MSFIQENVDLKAHSTMRLGGQARYLAEAASEPEIGELVTWAQDRQLPLMMIGDGSNIVWRDEGFTGLIIVNKLMSREVLQEDENGALIRLGGGENWDQAVAWTVDHGWSGIEFLSAIPGTCGAGPVQNIGAYGAEISQVLVELRVYDTQARSFTAILKADCGFAYRTSRFKVADKGRFMISAVTLRLAKTNPTPPFYNLLTKYFEERGISSYTPAAVREAVIAIRQIRLPDPSVAANNGSFFVNPIIDHTSFDKLRSQYPDIQSWPLPDGRIKLAAGWLAEKAGFKGVHDPQTGMATWPESALVLVNERASSTAALLAFKQKIVDKVRELFGVTLEQEPELLP
jgi:UDP-N-acetylmuramate dehydrogenase